MLLCTHTHFQFERGQTDLPACSFAEQPTGQTASPYTTMNQSTRLCDVDILTSCPLNWQLHTSNITYAIHMQSVQIIYLFMH